MESRFRHDSRFRHMTKLDKGGLKILTKLKENNIKIKTKVGYMGYLHPQVPKHAQISESF